MTRFDFTLWNLLKEEALRSIGVVGLLWTLTLILSTFSQYVQYIIVELFVFEFMLAMVVIVLIIRFRLKTGSGSHFIQLRDELSSDE